MRKTYYIENLSCASCAGKIEEAVGRLPEVREARLNFTTKKLMIISDQPVPEGYRKTLEDLADRIEAGVRLREEPGIRKKALSWGRPAAVLFSIVLLVGALSSRSPGLALLLFILSYLLAGGDILLRAVKNLLRGEVFDENFLMSLATLGAFAIREYPEGVAVMLFYKVGEWFQDQAVEKSRRSIEALMDIRPDYANRRTETGSGWERVHPEQIPVGEEILVRTGEKVPLDGTVIQGEALMDTAALTGEPVPRRYRAGDRILSGLISRDGIVVIRTEKNFGDSTVSRILELVENAAGRKAVTEKFITRFSRVYTPAVVGVAATLALLMPLILSEPFRPWIYNALIFLVVSCPCALVISVPLGFFGGLGQASRMGVLVKGGNYLEILEQADTVVFDKTGTLTEGQFRVREIRPEGSLTREDLLQLAAALEAHSSHPIALSIRQEAGFPEHLPETEGYREIPGRGITALVDGVRYHLGGNALLEDLGISVPLETGTMVYLAGPEGLLGSFKIEDRIRADAPETIRELRQLGIRHLVMLTGDNPAAASAVGEALELDQVHAGLLPEEKVRHLEELVARSPGKTLFVGDGINDAPVLARADAGVAMGGLGSDAAIEAADVVIMEDRLSRLPEVIRLARRTKGIVWQNISMALGVKFLVMGLGLFGLATMWMAVFADVGVALLAVVNSLRILHQKI